MFIQRLMVIKALSLRNVWTVKTLRKKWFAGDYQETKSKKVTLNCETSPLKATFYFFKLALQAFWRVKAFFLLSVPKKLISIHFVTSTIELLAMNKRWQTKPERSFKCFVGVIMISRQFYIVLDCATHWNISLPTDFLWRIAGNCKKWENELQQWIWSDMLIRRNYENELTVFSAGRRLDGRHVIIKKFFSCSKTTLEEEWIVICTKSPKQQLNLKAKMIWSFLSS